MALEATETLALAEDQTGALTDAGKPVLGGNYAIVASGTIGTSVLEIKNPHGDWVPYGDALAAGWVNIHLPAGLVRANLGAGASAAYVYASRIPN